MSSGAPGSLEVTFVTAKLQMTTLKINDNYVMMVTNKKKDEEEEARKKENDKKKLRMGVCGRSCFTFKWHRSQKNKSE